MASTANFRLTWTQKTELGQELAKWYAKFGKVTPRRPYHDDSKGGDSSGAAPVFETHPLLSQLPVGASSDLAFVDNNNPRVIETAEARNNELKDELRNKLEYTYNLRLQNSLKFAIRPDAKPM